MKQYQPIAMVLALLFACFNTQASTDMKIYRNGHSKMRVVYDFWSGMFPEPVLVVGQNDTSTTTIDAFKRFEKLNAPVKCTIQNGIYHPWSKEKLSVDSYFTIAGITTVKVLKDTKFDEYNLRKGDHLDSIYYQDDNFCSGMVHTAQKDFRIEFKCNRFSKLPKYFAVHEEDPNYFEQWLALNCSEGYQAYVQDKALLKQPHVSQGKIIEHGVVSRE